MSTKKFIKEKFNYQCQICGDRQGKTYPSGVKVEVQIHHIIPRVKGGKTEINNLIPLCDQCHAVLHPQRWREHFGEKGTPSNMDWIKNDLEWYITLPPQEREKIKRELWQEWGIK